MAHRGGSPDPLPEPGRVSYVTHPEPLSLNQAAEAARVSRSTVKRRLEDLVKAGAYRAPSGEWRIPVAALSVLTDGSSGSDGEPLDPRREPRDPPQEGTSEDLKAAREELVHARLEAAEWRARAEERSERIVELARRAEAAEERLDRMITSQTALALTLKEQQQLTAAATAPREATEPDPPPAEPAYESQHEPVAPRAPVETPSPAPQPVHESSSESERPLTMRERYRRWRSDRQAR